MLFIVWSIRDSNSSPLDCQSNALAEDELMPQTVIYACKYTEIFHISKQSRPFLKTPRHFSQNVGAFIKNATVFYLNLFFVCTDFLSYLSKLEYYHHFNYNPT